MTGQEIKGAVLGFILFSLDRSFFESQQDSPQFL